jgi:hypothetical protein
MNFFNFTLFKKRGLFYNKDADEPKNDLQQSGALMEQAAKRIFFNTVTINYVN